MRLIIYSIFLFLICFQSVIYSQSQDASPAGIMISHSHPVGGWMFTYEYMHMYMDKNLSGSKSIDDPSIWNNYIFSTHNMQMDMHMLMGMYGMTGRLSFMLMTSYMKSGMDLYLPAGVVLVHHHSDSSTMNLTTTNHSHSTSGFGDLKLWAIYKLFNGTGSSVVFSAGISIPTAEYQISAGEHALYDGEHHPYMMQPGSGSIEFMPGLTYLKNTSTINWSLQLLSTIRPFYNSTGYHYGNELNANAWFAYKMGQQLSSSLRLEALSTGAISGRDKNIYDNIEPDANPENYGGQRVNAYIGVNYYLNSSFFENSKIMLEIGTPVYQNLNGPQLSTSHIIHLGITKSF